MLVAPVGHACKHMLTTVGWVFRTDKCQPIRAQLAEGRPILGVMRVL